MTTNKQSEKRQDSIRVIEEKTLKTLIKKENKQMNTKPNYSLNKTIKSISTSRKYPEYKLENNALIDIQLPNGMRLSISSNEDGSYCSLAVTNFTGGYNSNRGNFETRIEDEFINRDLKRYSFKSNSIQSNNYTSYYKSEINKQAGFKFELREFTRK